MFSSSSSSFLAMMVKKRKKKEGTMGFLVIASRPVLLNHNQSNDLFYFSLPLSLSRSLSLSAQRIYYCYWKHYDFILSMTLRNGIFRRHYYVEREERGRGRLHRRFFFFMASNVLWSLAGVWLPRFHSGERLCHGIDKRNRRRRWNSYSSLWLYISTKESDCSILGKRNTISVV